MTFVVQVRKVRVEGYSTLAFGEGRTEGGEWVEFVGDHRPMATIGEAIESGEDVWVEVPSWSVLRVTAEQPQEDEQ